MSDLWRDMPFADRPKGHPSTERLEIEQLRAERDGLLRVVTDNHDALVRAETAEARVAELEAALEKISEYLPDFDYCGTDEFGVRPDFPGSPFDRGRQQEACHLSSIARAALKGTKT